VPPAKRELSSRARRSWVGIAALVLIAAGALLAVLLISGGNSPGGGGALKNKGTLVPIESATDFDPAGDGEEDPETVSFAVDGNPTGTAWTSEHYDSPDFAGTKSGTDPGVGLYVTSESPAQPTKMVVEGAPGWDAQIYAAASGPPEELSEWGEPVGAVVDADEREEVQLDVPSPSRYFLIWFNKAAPSRDQVGRYQLEISDVKLIE
jgi:putative peptidoglycan lipid II flippase